MYSDKTEKGRGLLKLLPILIALLLILLFFARHPRSDLEDEGAAAVRAASTLGSSMTIRRFPARPD